MRATLGISLGAVLLVVQSSLPSRAEDADPLKAVREGYLSNLPAFRNVSISYSVHQQVGAEIARQRGGSSSAPMKKRVVRSGDRWLLSMEPYRFPGSDSAIAQFHSFDGTNAWQLGFDRDHAAHVQAVTKFHGFVPWTKPQIAEPDRLTGTMLDDDSTSLEGLFATGTARLDGSEVISGQTCVRITFGKRMLRGGAISEEMRAWFDPAMSYLQRRIEVRTVAEDAERVEAPRGREFRRTIETTEFQGVYDPAMDGERPFPARGRISTPMSQQEIVIDHVQLGLTVNRTAFIPEVPADAVLIERHKDRPTVQTVAGRRATPVDLIRQHATAAQQLASDAEAGSPASSREIDASVPTGSWTPMILMIGFGAMAIVSFIYWRQRAG